MKVNNLCFNKWLEEEKEIKWTGFGYLRKHYTENIGKDELIGLITQYLLDNDYEIDKEKDVYIVYSYRTLNDYASTNLFTVLKDAIEGMEE